MKIFFIKIIFFCLFFLIVPFYLIGDIHFDRYLKQVVENGNVDEIQDYIEFQYFYNKILGYLKEEEYFEALNIINGYIIKKRDIFNQQNKSSTEKNIRQKKFLLYMLLIKGISLYKVENKSEGIENIYLSYSGLLDVYLEINPGMLRITFFSNHSFIYRNLLETASMDNILTEILSGIYSSPYLNPNIIYDRDAEVEKKNFIIGEIISGVSSSGINELKSIISKYKFFRILFPIKDALLITYNPKNKDALHLMKKINKEMGGIINNEKDEKYHFLQFKILKNNELEKRLLKKHVLDLK